MPNHISSEKKTTLFFCSVFLTCISCYRFLALNYCNLLCSCLMWVTSRVYCKHLFRSVTQQKYSILNGVFKLNLHKKLFFMQVNQDFVVYLLKRKLGVSLSKIFSQFNIYKMKDEMNSQIPFLQRLKEYSLTPYIV